MRALEGSGHLEGHALVCDLDILVERFPTHLPRLQCCLIPHIIAHRSRQLEYLASLGKELTSLFPTFALTSSVAFLRMFSCSVDASVREGEAQIETHRKIVSIMTFSSKRWLSLQPRCSAHWQSTAAEMLCA
eukprot:2126698-Rhodomonas_salina.3